MTERRRRIGVLGSARLGTDDPRHKAAVSLGADLAKAGYEVATGGYGGLMAAVSQGASDAGGHVVGLTMGLWPELAANRWVAEEIVVSDWFDRLRHLATCDVLVALDGGIGTLAELTTTWANAQTDPSTNPPIILVGPAWAALVREIGQSLVVDPSDIALVRIVTTASDVPAAIADLLSAGDRTGHRYG